MATSRSLNKVMIIGNLTRDPVVKTTPTGATVCTFGIATNSSWKDEKGEMQERTEFHNIVAWNKLAEICAQLLSVGMLVYVEGEIRTRTWDDENSVRHYRTEVRITDMKLLDSKGKSGVGISGATASSDEQKEKEDVKEKAKKEDKKEEDRKEKNDEEKGDDDVSPEDLPF
ncbi:MAG: single-stranded DNA-binding protein [Candidatus Dojkabacteria bacterium]|nr:single-stranded DNA-binding protein [Candidatus Dojkabacteria bacterium]